MKRFPINPRIGCEFACEGGLVEVMKSNNKTGYPSIDKPWVKYYRENPIRKFDINQKLYTMIWSENQDNLSKKAINYFGIKGNNFSYKELFNMSHRLASAYIKAGVKQGDTVLIATVSGPEEALNLLALNQIGAVSKWVDITIDEENLCEAIIEDQCRIMVCFAAVIPKVQKIIQGTCCEQILYVEPKQFIRKSALLHGAQAINDIRKLVLTNAKDPLPAIPNEEKYIDFIKFLKNGDKGYLECAAYDKEAPVLKIQSSGTTGKPKTIVHTDYSINHSIAKNAGIDLPLYRGNVLFKIAPSWVGYGLITSMALPLAFGMTVLTLPSFDSDLLVRMNNKYDMVLGVPFLYRYLADHIYEIKDMLRPQALVSGGDKISKSEIESFQSIYETKGCSAPILNGAGCNEICGPGCVNPLMANRPGSVGVPEYGDTIGIFDTDTLEELPFGKKGEICYQTLSSFAYYNSNPEKTKEVKIVHPNGNVWIHTKDIGYIDEDGYLYIEGRLTRVITVGGFKISANTIEEALECCECIKECIAISVPDKEWGEVPMLFAVLADGVSETEGDTIIREECRKKIKGRAIPKYYRYVKELPYTSGNKF